VGTLVEHIIEVGSLHFTLEGHPGHPAIPYWTLPGEDATLCNGLCNMKSKYAMFKP
jgi:hypothetical protein